MPVFSQLNEYDKVQAIRDTFIKLFVSVVNTPENLNHYIKEEERKTDAYVKVEGFIRKQNKLTGCLCGNCVDLSVINTGIPSELELLLDVAKKIAETKSY